MTPSQVYSISEQNCNRKNLEQDLRFTFQLQAYWVVTVPCEYYMLSTCLKHAKCAFFIAQHMPGVYVA